ETYSFYHSWGNKYFNYALSGSYSHQSGVTTADTNPVGNAYRLYGATFPNDARLDNGTKVVPGRKDIPYRSGDNLNKLMDDGDRDKGERYSVGLNLNINLFKNNTLRINPSYSFLDFYTAFSPGDIPISDASGTFLQFFLRVINRRDSLNIADKWDITPNLTYNFRMGLIKSTDLADFIFVNDYVDYSKEKEALGFKDEYSGGGNSPFHSAPDFMLNRSFDFANELSYKFNFLDGVSLLVGHEYSWSKSVSPGSYTKSAPKRTGNSFYFQNLWTYKKLTVSLGARWDQMTTFIEDFDDELSPRFGINYQFKPGTSLRFSVGRARRFPEYARQFGFAQSAGKLFGNPFIGPEINWTYELGFHFSTKYLSGDIAYFYDDYSDFEIPLPVSAAGYADGGDYTEKVFGIPREQFAILDKDPSHPRAHFFTNGPDVVAQGFDTTFDANPVKNWNISVSYLFQRHTVGNRNPFDFRQGTPQELWLDSKGKAIGPKFQGGNRIIYTPTHIFKVSSDYTFPFGLRLDVTGRFKSTVKFVSAVYPGGIFNQPEHWIWDLKFSQPLFNNKIKLTFSIENVFSKLYYESGGIPSNVAKYTLGVSATF
ncbi:MAG: TonB-dependent receptor, partial [Candidatus Schekmanbacteria bacterium]